MANNLDPFVDVLRKARESAGYKSSRGFYNARGGQRFFNCTYRQYLNVENGKTRPGPRLIEKLIIGLGLLYDKQQARAFSVGYLHSVTGSAQAANLIADSLAEPSAKANKSQSPMVRSMARIYKERSVRLNEKQFEFLTASASNYWCFALLSNDTDSWEPAALAKKLELALSDVRKSLTRLVKLGLIEKRGGRYRDPDPTRVILFPSEQVYTVGFQSIRKFREQMGKKQGKTMLRYHLFGRASEAELRQYFPYLIEGVQGATVCSTQTAGEDTLFYEIETNVKQILPY